MGGGWGGGGEHGAPVEGLEGIDGGLGKHVAQLCGIPKRRAGDGEVGSSKRRFQRCTLPWANHGT